MAEYASLAARLKEQLNDIIDVAYKDRSTAQRGQYKRFTIICSDKVLKTRNGDCRHNRVDRTSTIRLLRLEDRAYMGFVITAIHEVAHHIDFSNRNQSGHDAPFYIAFKKLLFAALDMGVITMEFFQQSRFESQNGEKILRMVREEYVPDPIDYKPDSVQIHVYNAFTVKDALKGRKYRWNAADAAWVLLTTISAIEREQAFLRSIGVKSDDIRIIEGSAVVTRLRKNVRLSGVTYDQREIVKSLGFRWNKEKKLWEKKIAEDVYSIEEANFLREQIPEIKINVC